MHKSKAEYYKVYDKKINVHKASQAHGLKKFCGICRRCKHIIDLGAPGCWDVDCDIGTNHGKKEGTLIEMVCKYYKRDSKKSHLFNTNMTEYFKELQK